MIIQPSVQDLEARAGELFAPTRLASVFELEIAHSPLRGLDRVGSARFRQNLDRETRVIASKVLVGSYRFTPYRQLLRPCGAKKPPRRLAVATVRDRIVLYTLKELLHEAFPDAVNRTAPNKLIRDIRTDTPRLQDAVFVKTDIRSFYDSIDQKRMLDTISPTLPGPILRLIERALRNPILVHGNRRARNLTPLAKGVPQGLAISNILAEIYLHSLDQVMHANTLTYRRYVDDVLMFVQPGTEAKVKAGLASRLAGLDLELNEDKSEDGPATTGFDYLGYRLELPNITVKDANVQKLITSIAALIGAHKHRNDVRYATLNEDQARSLLLDELNDKITGAIGKYRRYGWLFYFLEITDMTLLFHLDHVVRSLWRRIRDETPPEGLKRFVRAYHEAQFNARGGYIHDYTSYTTEQSMRDFLERRELDSEAQDLPVRQVMIRFQRTMRRNLARLEADVGFIS